MKDLIDPILKIFVSFVIVGRKQLFYGSATSLFGNGLILSIILSLHNNNSTYFDYICEIRLACQIVSMFVAIIFRLHL